mmetsp:Transcript_31059/g.90577  ORF Transcript_31059/g.90577 Transcript_31059/m.90577 type:complete len:222 (-) Transcript_31059:2203-2868(-)
MTTGHVGTDNSLRCSNMSATKNSANARCSFMPSHLPIRSWHSFKHCRKSCGAIFMTAPIASSRLRRHASSSSTAWSSSSSSCWSSGGAPALSFCRSFSALIVRCMEASMNWKSWWTNCRTSWPPSTPVPEFRRHSARPSAASFNVSGSSSLAMAVQIFWRNVRNNSLAIDGGWLSFVAADLAHLIKEAQHWNAALRASSQSIETSSEASNKGRRFCATSPT